MEGTPLPGCGRRVVFAMQLRPSSAVGTEVDADALCSVTGTVVNQGRGSCHQCYQCCVAPSRPICFH